MYANNVYGSSVFQPIGTEGASGYVKRDKRNMLEEDVRNKPIQHLYGGGFYVIKGVQCEEDKYADIWILVEQIEDLEHMKQLKLKNDLPEEKRKKVLIKYSEIKSSLNGVGRIIKYDVKNKLVHPDNNSITMVEEGKFRNGLLDGYARRYNATE